MTKGTPSKGKRVKTLHKTCRRCGSPSFHVKQKKCARCGFGDTTKMNQASWKRKDLLTKKRLW